MVLYAGLVSLLAACLAATPSDAADKDWTLCMTADAPAAKIVERCSRVLRRRDLAAFHRSLLLGAEGDALRRLHQDRKAIAAYSEALILRPGDEIEFSGRGEAEEALGWLQAARTDYDAAIERHEADPANRSNGSADVLANYHALRGRLLLSMGRPSAALKDLGDAIILYPAGATPQLKALVAQAKRASAR